MAWRKMGQGMSRTAAYETARWARKVYGDKVKVTKGKSGYSVFRWVSKKK